MVEEESSRAKIKVFACPVIEPGTDYNATNQAKENPHFIRVEISEFSLSMPVTKYSPLPSNRTELRFIMPLGLKVLNYSPL